MVPSIIGDDVEGCADLLRPMYALYIGGMGAREVNFHFDVFSRLGYDDEVPRHPGPVPRRPQGRGHRQGAHRPWSRTSP